MIDHGISASACEFQFAEIFLSAAAALGQIFTGPSGNIPGLDPDAEILFVTFFVEKFCRGIVKDENTRKKFFEFLSGKDIGLSSAHKDGAAGFFAAVHRDPQALKHDSRPCISPAAADGIVIEIWFLSQSDPGAEPFDTASDASELPVEALMFGKDFAVGKSAPPLMGKPAGKPVLGPVASLKEREAVMRVER